jgi:hypothetical protein
MDAELDALWPFAMGAAVVLEAVLEPLRTSPLRR